MGGGGVLGVVGVKGPSCVGWWGSNVDWDPAMLGSKGGGVKLVLGIQGWWLSIGGGCDVQGMVAVQEWWGSRRWWGPGGTVRVKGMIRV